jgi:tetratricopeptide (TPR) repeat protein
MLLLPIGGVMARQPEEVTELRRGLGALLAACLDASPLNQGDLARGTNYHRSSISHIIAGRQFPERSFWEKADSVVNAGGTLVMQYDKVCDQEEQLKQAELERRRTERRALANNALQKAQGSQLHNVLFRDYRHPSGHVIDVQSPPIDADYIETVRQDIKAFVRHDQQYGGAVTSPLILRALRRVRRRMDSSEVPDKLFRDMNSAAAELAEVAGWSLYDAEEHAQAEQANHEALKLARLAGDRSMELFILQNMSMHEGHLARARDSLNTARLALGMGRLSPRLQCLFKMREARALAQLGKESDAFKQFNRAKGLYLEGVRDSDPHWTWWVDETELAWHEGMINKDLGKLSKSLDYFDIAANGISEARVRTCYSYRASAFLSHVENRSWSNAEESMRILLNDAGFVGSRRGDLTIEHGLKLLERADATDTVYDLASALRVALDNAA